MTEGYQVDVNWVVDQLHRAGYTGARQPTGTSVRILVEKLNAMMSDRATKLEVIELFSRLASGQSIAADNVQGTVEWVDFDLSLAKTGDTVRIRDDAYETSGSEHNGRTGHLVGARAGQAIVQYAGSTEGSGSRHAPEKLLTVRGA